jgi:hypothetical protein
MQKLEAAVIHMEKVFQEVDFLVGSNPIKWETLLGISTMPVLDDTIIGFLSEVSSILFKNPLIRDYPDVATFAFFCRRSQLMGLRDKVVETEGVIKVGRGIVFHVTPGNVPVNFAYSFFAGLITGNINIVKVPSKEFVQIQLIVDAIKTVLQGNHYRNVLSDRIFIIRYDRNSKATDYFSEICDVRVIWGGDETIRNIRNAKLQAKSIDITFADRYSISIMNAKEYLHFQDKYRLALDFFNDTYLTDQNACTSPQTLYWLGEEHEIRAAKEYFWDYLQQALLNKNFHLQPILAIDKLVTFYSQAISMDNIHKENGASNDIWRISNNSIDPNVEKFKSKSGYFNETSIKTLKEINTVVNRKYQTIGYFGFKRSELAEWINEARPSGIDRIVPIGKTMDFSLFWDGYDLLSNLTRSIQIL